MSHRAAKRKRHPPDYTALRKLLLESAEANAKFAVMMAECAAAIKKNNG